jgi:hypothetical protein
MAKTKTVEEITQYIELLSTADQIIVLKNLKEILAEKEKAASDELSLLKNGKQ